jgi:DNA polymerase-3 subunit delta
MYNYIITTDDISAANEKIEQIKSSLSSEYDEISYDIEEEGLYSLVDELTTVSLFDSLKFVVVKGAEAITKASDAPLKELYSAMNDRNSENVLIFLFTKDTDYQQSEKFKNLRKYSTYIDIRIKNIPLDQYAKNVFENDGYKITDQTLGLLITYVDSLSSLKRAIEILELYKAEEKKILTADIELMITKPLDNDVYQLISAFLINHTKEVFSIYKDLKVVSKIQVSFLVSLLINKFQEMYNVSILLKGGMSQNDIAALFNVSQGRAYYMVKNAKSSNLGKIKANLEDLVKLDADIKSGKTKEDLGLELFFLK